MAYSKTYKAFKRAKKYLDLFRTSQEVTVINVPNPKEVQYHIHEGMYVAEYLKIPLYSELKGKWRIKFSDRAVIVTPIITPEKVQVEYENLHDAFEVVEKLSRLKDTNCDVMLKNCVLSEDDKRLLTNWCFANGKTFTVSETGVMYIT